MIKTIPLIQNHLSHTIIAWVNGQPISAGQFLADVVFVAAQLPNKLYAINLCTQRYHFLVSFCAILIRQQTNILPPNKLVDAINELLPTSDDTYYITDDASLCLHQQKIIYPDINLNYNEESFDIPGIPLPHIAAVTYTSGSTGQPQKQYKTWRSLITIAKRCHDNFNIYNKSKPVTLVATVPTQHMFGLETSVMLPLQQGYSMLDHTPFYPQDIQATLTHCPQPCALITTPLHLNACLKADINIPSLDFILSATAPLSIKLAKQAENNFSTTVLEIYGCTEAGTIATRRTSQSHLWKPLQGINISYQAPQWILEADYLSKNIVLPDQIQLHDHGELELLGRNQSMVNIGGKRTSLEALNHHLTNIKGVDDGTFFIPDNIDDQQQRIRLIAFVVSKHRDKQEIIQQLRKKIDALFIPRTFYWVNALPRSETGKLPRKALSQLYQQQNHD